MQSRRDFLRATLSAAAIVRSSWAEGLRPDPKLTVTAWAEAHRVLSSRETASPGPYRTGRHPYVVEIQDALSASSPVQRVSWMKGAQIAATESANNFVGYTIDQAPGPVLFVLPTVDMSKRHSKQRIGPMIEGSDRLRGRVRDARSRDSGNTLLVKEFAGGILCLTGANSAVGLRSMPAGKCVFDEIDAWPPSLGDEGDPVTLAERATRTFPRRKVFLLSTPTIRGRSRIEAEFLKGDRSRYWVPCPACGTFQLLFWQDKKSGRRGIEWEGHPNDATFRVWFHCQADGCGERIDEGHKLAMLQAGEWRAEIPERSRIHRSFHLSALYAPPGSYSWTDAVRQWLDAEGNTEKLRIFVNHTLGETWEEKGDAPPWEELYQRREHYARGTVPAGGLVLTAGVDVQADRLEVEVVAWGRDLESWSIDYVVLPGDPGAAATWKELDRVLSRQYPHASGVALPIRMSGVDSGFETQTVYRYVRKKGQTVHALKGSDSFSVLIGSPSYVDVSIRGRKLRRGIRLWTVGTGVAKRELYGFLRQAPALEEGEGAPVGFCHFPEYGPDYFQQLTAEQLVARANPRGYLVYSWEKTQERNEALDCRVYARAAAAILGIDRWREPDWDRIGAALGQEKAAASSSKGERRSRPRQTGRYRTRWRGPKRN